MMFYKMNKSIIMIPEESTKPNDTDIVFDLMIEEQLSLNLN